MLQVQQRVPCREATSRVDQQLVPALCYAPMTRRFAAMVHWGGPKRTELKKPLKRVRKEV
jgi:hypothetical protein